MSRKLASEVIQTTSSVYLDCAATTPIEPAVLNEMLRVWTEEPGNSGSRTHEYGLRAKKIIQNAREQVASVVRAKPEEVIFTSGATESNNIAVLGLMAWGMGCGRRHIVSTSIEHKAVLEPLREMEKQGFEVTLLPPDSSGAVSVHAVSDALRPDTLLVSIMQVNNETGIRQPIGEISTLLADHDAYFHVDAAQGFGKDIEVLRNNRIDLIACSSHKIFGPMGVGCLIARSRDLAKVPLAPIFFGGGQERGLRPGTLPVPLIAGMGLAAEMAERDYVLRKEKCLEVRAEALDALNSLNVTLVGDQTLALSHILSFAVEGVDSEAMMVALKDVVAVSNGSACTSQSYEPSHVLTAMGVSEGVLNGAVRMSWCHLTPHVNWREVSRRISELI
ncbi:MAG: cysteine desulfurase DndA [Candidatus Dadabacteria bacterium]|nr:cysteine desulfurase DndA [Candidatus Dadabacteria bacterium]